MKKTLLTLTAFASLTMASQAQEEQTPDGVMAIQEVYPDAYYLGTDISQDGTHIFWDFRVPGYQAGHYVFVDVTTNCEPSSFGAACTVALDGIRFYKKQQAGERLPKYNPIHYPPANLTDILNTFPDVRFLGCTPALNGKDIRWMFYYPATDISPGVVVNVSPVETADQFTTAYWTALGAVQAYIRFGDVPPRQHRGKVNL